MSDADIRNVVVVALAEDMGLLDERDRLRDLERDRLRDLEKAREMLILDIPAEKISKVMNIPLEMVKTLA